MKKEGIFLSSKLGTVELLSPQPNWDLNKKHLFIV